MSRLEERAPPSFASAAGLAAVALGVSSLAGWSLSVAGEPPPPMATTPVPLDAVGLVLIGAGLSCLRVGGSRATALFAAAALALALLTLLNSLFGLDLGIDRLIGPARGPNMGPNTSLCLGLGAAALLLLLPSASGGCIALANGLALIAVALASVALAGHLTAIDTARRWGTFPPMALGTALGLVLVGTGIFVLTLRSTPDRRRRWLPFSIAVAGIAGSVCVWLAFSDLKGTLSERLRSMLIPESFVNRHFPIFMLAIGVVLTFLICLAVHLGQKAAQRSRERRRALRALQKTHLALKHAHRDLEQRVAERTQEIATVNEHLEREIVARKQLEAKLWQKADSLAEMDRRKDAFLTMLGHELRNPLAALALGLETMGLDEGDPSKQADTRAVMKARLDYILRLMDDLLDISRISRGKITLQKKPLELRDVIHDSVATLRPQLEERALELSLDLGPRPIHVDGDPVRLEQVLMNLLSNAIRYTDPGGRIAIRAERGDDEVEVTFEDTGIGIPPELLPRIYDPFTRAEEFTDRDPGGLGIGLALVRHLVTLHGGTIRAASEGPGSGSTFVITLPLSTHAPAPAAAPPPAPAPLPRGLRRRVLIVDDNPEIAHLTRRLIEAWGHDAVSALNGETGLKLARSHRPDVAVVDISLPGMSGFELARRLRESDPGLMLIAVTGYGLTYKPRIDAAGFDRHFTKPIDPVQLRTILNGNGR